MAKLYRGSYYDFKLYPLIKGYWALWEPKPYFGGLGYHFPLFRVSQYGQDIECTAAVDLTERALNIIQGMLLGQGMFPESSIPLS